MKQKRKNGKGGERSQAELMVMAIADIIQELVAAQQTGKDVDMNRLKTAVSARYGLRAQPRRVDLIAAAPPPLRNLLLPKLRAKPVRTASGVAVVAVMCKPHRCPHINFTGNICVYCPGGPDSDFEYSTQSYTGYEPTSMRAIRARYDPYLQTRHRVEQLQQLGHSVDKVEFVLMGGTFMALPEDYRQFFIRSLHDALSGHTSATVAEAIRDSFTWERIFSQVVAGATSSQISSLVNPWILVAQEPAWMENQEWGGAEKRQQGENPTERQFLGRCEICGVINELCCCSH